MGSLRIGIKELRNAQYWMQGIAQYSSITIKEEWSRTENLKLNFSVRDTIRFEDKLKLRFSIFMISQNMHGVVLNVFQFWLRLPVSTRGFGGSRLHAMVKTRIDTHDFTNFDDHFFWDANYIRDRDDCAMYL